METQLEKEILQAQRKDIKSMKGMFRMQLYTEKIYEELDDLLVGFCSFGESYKNIDKFLVKIREELTELKNENTDDTYF